MRRFVGMRVWPVRPIETAVLVLVFGLLLWARLILVTGHPRTAIARPERNPVQGALKHSGSH